MANSFKGTNFYDVNQETTITLTPEYDKDGYLLSSKKVVDHLLSHIVPVEYHRREFDSAIKNWDYFTMSSNDIKRNLEKFSRNYGEFCDGKKLRLYNSEYYFKFTANIVVSVDDGIIKTNDEQPLFSLISLKERSNSLFPTLSVYIDGKKVPDEKIYIYMGESSTDILIPLSYVNPIIELDTSITYKPMEIYVQKHVFLKHHYFNRFFPGVTNASITFEITDEELIHCKLNDKNFMVFANGSYRLPSSYNLVRNGNIITIRLGAQVISGEDVEVIVDSDIQVINTEVIDRELTNGKTTRYYFNLRESKLNYLLDYIYGPIPKKNCYFFLNNLRIPNNKVSQIGRMNFGYDSENLGTRSCTVIYTDRKYIDESHRYIYGEDYYISNMLSVENVCKLLEAVESKDSAAIAEVNEYICAPDLGLDYQNMMNKNGKLYSDEYAEKILNIPRTYGDYESQTRELIKEAGNYLIRDYLNLYGKNELYITLVVPEEDRPEFYSFTFNEKKDLKNHTTKRYYIIDINGTHVKDTEIEIKDNHQYDDIFIPSSLFQTGVNRIHIREHKFDSKSSEYIEYKEFKTENLKEITLGIDSDEDKDGTIAQNIQELRDEISTLQRKIEEEIDEDKISNYNLRIAECISEISAYEALIGKYRYQIRLDKFTSAIDLSDYCCLTISQNESDFYYDPNYNDNTGWKIKTDVSFVENTDGTITCLFESKPNFDNFVLYSKRFAFKYTTVVQNEIQALEDISIAIRSASSLRIPIIPSGGYSVYLNDERLFNGIDYVFRHPGNYDIIAYSSLALKRKTHPGDVITIYFNDVKNVTVDRSNDIISHAGVVYNKYGLIYFGSLNFPYSPRYVDLYINGKFIYPDQIEILSDKLIRVDQEILNPMYDIFAETSFSVDTSKLSYFFDYDGNRYKDSDFEKVIKRLFTDFDFSTLTSPSSDSSGNDVYASFDSDVDSWGGIPNVLRDGETEEEQMENAEKEVPTRYSLLENAYLLWLKSVNSKTIMKPSEDIKKKIVNFFKFYVEETSVGKRQDVIVNVRNTNLFNTLVFGLDGYPISHAERVRLFLGFIKSQKLISSVNQDDDGTIRVVPEKQAGINFFNEAKNSLQMANRIYPRDFPKAISSRSKLDISEDILLSAGSLSEIQTSTKNNSYWRK